MPWRTWGQIMFGFGRRADSSGSPSPPPNGSGWPPYKKIDDALTIAIRLYSKAVWDAGKSCGGLGLRGPVPPNVGMLLADCVVEDGPDGPIYLTFGSTRDFKSFQYAPHCRLFLMINAAKILQEFPTGLPSRNEIAINQVPRCLLDAWLLKRWIKSIGPLGEAMTRGRGMQAIYMARAGCGAIAPIPHRG